MNLYFLYILCIVHTINLQIATLAQSMKNTKHYGSKSYLLRGVYWLINNEVNNLTGEFWVATFPRSSQLLGG